MLIKKVQLPPVPYAHQTQVKVNMTNYSLLLGNTGKTVVWENWHINQFQVFYTAMFSVTAYVEQVLWKAQRQHWIGPLCSFLSLLLLPYLVPNTILQQLYTHIPSPYRIRPLKEPLFTETQEWLTLTFGRYLFKKHSSSPSIPSSSRMLTD